MRELRLLADDEQFDFLADTLESAVEEAEEVLKRHKAEEPPLFDVLGIGEATENYVNLVATQRRRLVALKYFLEEVNK